MTKAEWPDPDQRLAQWLFSQALERSGDDHGIILLKLWRLLTRYMLLDGCGKFELVGHVHLLASETIKEGESNGQTSH